ncbi:sodium/proline symporter [Desulfitispora alkaliphila]|uniref:sodium/proline symporter PutP n=1 Tax=Desulfitispora alkaliphila TaxID=622674 RepID=UPI003D2346F4
MISIDFYLVLAFVLYLAFVLSVGLIFYTKTNKMSDYILGDRKLNSWVASLSAQASDMSGWLLLGLPGAAYVSGIEAGWIAVGLAMGTYLNWKFVAVRLRKYTEIAGNSLTISDYFENRFRDKSKVLRVVSAIFILIFFVIYTASGFVAGGKLFETVFGVPYLTALTLGALFVVSYTFLGGFLAVSWTDFIQGTMMLFAIIIVPLVGIQLLGGWNSTVSQANAINPELMNPFTAIDGSPITAIAIISLLAWGLGYFGQPHILVRFMAISSSSQVKKARIIAMVWVTLSLSAAVLVGLVGRLYLAEPLEGPATETVFMVMAHQVFPSLVAGFLLAAILSAIMSTADSQLLVSASALTEDLYKGLLKPDAGDKELIWISRLAVIGVSIIAFTLALNPDENSVLDLVSYAWAGFGAAFGPTILLSLYWSRMTKMGALAGIVVGGLTVIIWHNLSGGPAGIFELYEIVPGFILSAIAIYLVSLNGKEPKPEVIEEFNSVEKSNI